MTPGPAAGGFGRVFPNRKDVREIQLMWPAFSGMTGIAVKSPLF